MADNTNKQTHITLADGTVIPQVGFGTYKLQGQQCYDAVRHAIATGYRHIDTAAVYANEQEVGRAIADAIAAGEITRKDLFVTTKVWNDCHGKQATEKAFHASMQRLGLDYLDCYLVHWPCQGNGLYTETWQTLVNLLGFGTVQTIGVCNFYPAVLDEIIAATDVTPVMNQIELHPGFSQATLRDYHQAHGIVTESWSPLGRGEMIEHPVVAAVAEDTGKTPAQVIIRWHMQLGCVVIPKSATPARIEENFDVFDFELTDGQMARLTALDGDDSAQKRRGPDPATFGVNQ
ncbi:aldo/keto reductase [Corynebacterium mendelii]|uniref:Aldo/keto reductase n=1 Tax=Corynebacterium mendelii TaxID=2765362 RepID=A0A939E1F2_9CORY|nr:aldo/keto reductase [Corynebacterium mendelii]MBN9644669.1 aldo/keto reductase [Corynebacterium mendelii]